MDDKEEVKDYWHRSGILTQDPLGSDNVTKCSDVGNKMQIKEEIVDLEYEVLPQSSSVDSENRFLYNEDDRTDIKIEIEEEPWWLDRSADVDDDGKETEKKFVLGSPARKTSSLCTELSWVSNNATRRKDCDNDGKGNTVSNASEFVDRTQTHTNNSDASTNKPSKRGTDKERSSSSSRLNDSTEKPHKCDQCEESFLYLSNLKLHKLVHEIQREYTCEICKTSFKYFSHLKRHFSTHFTSFPQQQNKLIRKDKSSLKCEVCWQTFTRLSNLKRHTLVHDNKRDFKCEICEKALKCSSTLRRHILVHRGNRPYECEICNKSFVTRTHLKRHKIIHNRE